MMWRTLLVVLAVIASSLVSGCSEGDTSVPHLKVLFIGNSFTFYNGGIDQVLHGLAPNTSVDSATQGGYTLANHLADSATMAKLRQGGWDRVVLQEQSQYPLWAYASFVSSGRSLAAEARKLGAFPMLLMTWARPDSSGVTTTALKDAYTSAATRLGAEVIPAGTAFGASLKAHPEITLNEFDGHPTREGTYLAGCVVFTTIFRKSPVGNSFTGGLDAPVARALQEQAAQTTRG